MLKEIVITEQPVCSCVPKDFPVTLSCKAFSQAPVSLHYQWFLQGESARKEIPGATQPDLRIVANQTQLYICRVNDTHRNCVFSRWVKVKVVINVPKGIVPPGWKGEPIIVTQPNSISATSQPSVQLHCCALGIPAPQYQWYKNGHCLPDRRKRQILIKMVKPADCGSYLCCASNSQGEIWSEPAELTIGIRRADVCVAVGKVALLIGNNGYLNHPNLLAPMVDVWELSILLRSMGFCVVSLVDVTRSEMLTAVSQFLKMLDRGVYGLFYYAGHGYERSGRNYMVPIDAPQPYKPENCISVQKILQKMQDRKTALNVVLLDTCRKWYNSDCTLSMVTPLKPLGNTVYGYATSENAEAYEVQDGEFSSGIFMKYLKKHILEDKKVTLMLEEVLEDIGRDPLVTGKQVMEIRHSLKEPRALTDRICPLGSEHLNKTEWDHRCELPNEMVMFPCGVEVELRFQIVFSNLTHAFARLTTVPPHLTDIRILLYKPSEMADVSLTNSCRLDYLDSLLALSTGDVEVDCMLRLHGLQKCQDDIILKIDLHYTRLDSGLRLQESVNHSIPKPWIAKLFDKKDIASLERDNGDGTAPQNSNGTAPQSSNGTAPQSSNGTAPQSSNGTAPQNSRLTIQSQLTTNSSDNIAPAHTCVNAGEGPSSALSKSSSEPEENDETDINSSETSLCEKSSFCTVQRNTE
ncbi:mucosa-associated lymphoid tissue lymphoma translocation protein 1-like [Discoglossus pictus]